jgi:Methyltransferase domain
VNVIDQLGRDKPPFHAGGARRWDALPETLGYILSHSRPGMRTLETGCGASTVVFAATGSSHTTISPDVKEHELVLSYCEKIGVDTTGLTFVAGVSDEELPVLSRQQEQLDLAFIDGAHGFPFPAIDWHYVGKALKVDGIILLDDIFIPSISVVFRFARSEPSWRIEAILDQRCVAMKLISPLPEEDWTNQPFNRHLDYSFLPARERVNTIIRQTVSRIRRAIISRYPSVRELRRRQANR